MAKKLKFGIWMLKKTYSITFDEYVKYNEDVIKLIKAGYKFQLRLW